MGTRLSICLNIILELYRLVSKQNIIVKNVIVAVPGFIAVRFKTIKLIEPNSKKLNVEPHAGRRTNYLTVLILFRNK